MSKQITRGIIASVRFSLALGKVKNGKWEPEIGNEAWFELPIQPTEDGARGAAHNYFASAVNNYTSDPELWDPEPHVTMKVRYKEGFSAEVTRG